MWWYKTKAIRKRRSTDKRRRGRYQSFIYSEIQGSEISWRHRTEQGDKGTRQETTSIRTFRAEQERENNTITASQTQSVPSLKP